MTKKNLILSIGRALTEEFGQGIDVMQMPFPFMNHIEFSPEGGCLVLRIYLCEEESSRRGYSWKGEGAIPARLKEIFEQNRFSQGLTP